MGREKRANDHAKARDEAIEMCIRILEHGGGVDDLRKELEFRRRTGINSGFSHEELDRVSRQIKELTVNTMKVALAASVADAFGFGPKRVSKALLKFDKFAAYLENGWMSWLDAVDELNSRFHLELALGEGAANLKHWKRPEAEDIYEPADLIRKDDWDALLKEAGMTEGTSADGLPCVFYQGMEAVAWADRYEKIQAYDVIQGVLLGRRLEATLASRTPEPPRPGKARAKGRPQPRRKGERIKAAKE